MPLIGRLPLVHGWLVRFSVGEMNRWVRIHPVGSSSSFGSVFSFGFIEIVPFYRDRSALSVSFGFIVCFYKNARILCRISVFGVLSVDHHSADRLTDFAIAADSVRTFRVTSVASVGRPVATTSDYNHLQSIATVGPVEAWRSPILLEPIRGGCGQLVSALPVDRLSLPSQLTVYERFVRSQLPTCRDPTVIMITCRLSLLLD